MNQKFNSPESWLYAPDDRFANFKKQTDVPSPAKTFTFVDEREDSIDDGYLLVSVDSPDTWGNLPAIYHNGASGLSFADGHAEVRRWKDSETLRPGSVGIRKAPRDVSWINERASMSRTNSI